MKKNILFLSVLFTLLIVGCDSGNTSSKTSNYNTSEQTVLVTTSIIEENTTSIDSNSSVSLEEETSEELTIENTTSVETSTSEEESSNDGIDLPITLV